MTPFKTLLAAAAVLFAAPAFAQDGVAIEDAYARSNGAMGGTGAIFFNVVNHQMDDDRLIAVASDAAKMTEIHTHKQSADGVMQMMAVPEGIVIPGNESHAFARGGDHVMLMGLTRELKDGDTVTVKLTFEHAGEVEITAIVDNARKGPEAGHMGAMDGTGQMNGHGTMNGMAPASP